MCLPAHFTELDHHDALFPGLYRCSTLLIYCFVLFSETGSQVVQDVLKV